MSTYPFVRLVTLLITKYAIKDPPLHIADFGDVIDYRYVFCRNDNYSFIKK